MLADPKVSYLLDLSVIAHVDLNAFFAQVEQVRLGLSRDDPVVCAQWNSVIAVSYAARKYGINRMDTIDSARRKCQNLVVAHAAVYEKGTSHWAYHDGLPHNNNHKVLLDPYRRESRKIMRILREECDLLEKASVDECFLNLGKLIFERLTKEFPFLKDESKQDYESLKSLPEFLPSSINWSGVVFGLDDQNNQDEGVSSSSVPETIVEDWDDVCLMIGSQFLYNARKKIFDELEYTTSGGIGRTKKIAKLAGGVHKPDNQTVVPNKFVLSFLDSFPLTDISGMGGKIGSSILQTLNIPHEANSLKYIRENFDLQTLNHKLHNDRVLAEQVYKIVRGKYKENLQPRTVLKSFMSRKNFKFPVGSVSEAADWLKVFAADLVNRLLEVDEENISIASSTASVRDAQILTRPRTLTLQITTTSYEKHSKQIPLPIIQALEKLQETILTLAIDLLLALQKLFSAAPSDKRHHEEIITENGKIRPMASMSLVISNFHRSSGSSLIDVFLTRTDRFESPTEKAIARLLDLYSSSLHISSTPNNLSELPEINGAGSLMNNEERKKNITLLFEKFKAESKSSPKVTPIDVQDSYNISTGNTSDEFEKSKNAFTGNHRDSSESYCNICNKEVKDKFEHNDYHAALEFSYKLNGHASTMLDPSINSEPLPKKLKSSKGQSKLPF